MLYRMAKTVEPSFHIEQAWGAFEGGMLWHLVRSLPCLWKKNLWSSLPTPTIEQLYSVLSHISHYAILPFNLVLLQIARRLLGMRLFYSCCAFASYVSRLYR